MRPRGHGPPPLRSAVMMTVIAALARLRSGFAECKRRTKVIGRFAGENSAISLVRAVLDRASAGWRGVTMAPASTRLLHDGRLQPRVATPTK